MALDQAIPMDGFDAAEMWLSALRAAGRSPATLASYRHAVDKLRAWRPGDLTTLSRFEAIRFVQHLSDNYAPGGVASRVRSLRAFFGWLVNEEFVAANPFARIRISVPVEAKLTATEEDIDRMLARAKGNPRDVALLTLLADTGCRKGEIAAVTMADLDWRSGVVRLPQSKTVIRTVPLTDRTVVALGRWLKIRGVGPGSLWSSRRAPISDPYALVRKTVKRHSKGTLTPHALRRAFAVNWLGRGGSETGLMRIAGWSSLEMVKVYSRARADVLAADEFKRLMG